MGVLNFQVSIDWLSIGFEKVIIMLSNHHTIVLPQNKTAPGKPTLATKKWLANKHPQQKDLRLPRTEDTSV